MSQHRALKDLSHKELVNLIMNKLNLFPNAKCMCASCGDSADADVFFLCDDCNE